MAGLMDALWVELLKARRSRLPWLSAIGISLAPLVGGLFMVVLKDPEWARRLGLISSKAQLTAGTADWPTYFDLLAQAVAVGGLIVFGLVAIWEFGREYADRTAKDLLALPTSREAMVLAKFAVVAGWSAVLTLIVYLLGLAVGFAVGLPGWSAGLAAESAVRLATTAGLTIALVAPLAWAASAGRGYLPPVGALFLAIFLSQVIALLGWGSYFPWSVPALYSGVAGPDGQGVGIAAFLIVGLTGIVGVAGTAAWWRFADQT
ncbi:MAG TPA: ABC transporter permease [Chloroflexota bacterium]|nr:ABC transporter permease [Chloroflexota bacterium]